jgi:hypothetical protein
LFALEERASGTFLGFTGLSRVTFEAPFTPAVEIGWRLARAAWGQGFATESARAVATFAFDELGLEEIVSLAVAANERSRAVMRRLGMTHDPSDDFDHPLLASDSPLRRHVLYRLSAARHAARERVGFGAMSADGLSTREIVELYGAAWHERDEDARRALLERVWADGGTYCDPTVRLDGREALLAHMAGFQERRPGDRLELTSGVDEHDGWLRFGWRLLGADGALVLEGMDVGTLGPDGRLARIVGFFGPFPPVVA